jgi:short-subunit dehydrogenase
VELGGAHVLVTGASRGIGEGLARRFAAAGARVTGVARSAEAVGALARELDGHAVVADLTDRAVLGGLVGRVEAEAGPVDVLVNNAGVDVTGPLTRMGQDELARLVDLNVLAAMELARQALPGMIDRGRGHVLNVSSLAGVAVLPGMVPYAASKAALTHFTAGLRADLRGLPIGATAIEVGLVPTEMKDSVVGYAPTGASFRRLYRMGLLTDTPLDRLCDAAVRAVERDRRHVRLPVRARGLAAVTETPRRLVELALTGVRPR